MFSITTMASSTTKPVAIVNAMSERLSKLKPQRYMSAERADDGEGHRQARDDGGRHAARNTKITITTRTTASANSNCASATDARMVVVRSLKTARSTSDGKCGLQLGQQGLDAIDDGNDVGARLALHIHDDGGRGVGPGREVGVLRAVDDGGDIGEADGAPLR